MLKQVYLGDKLPKTIEMDNTKYRSVFVLPHKIYGFISIFKSKRSTPMPYMVGYGHSSIFFKTYEEARTFIKERFENNKY